MFRPSNLVWCARSRKQALASWEQAPNNNRNPVCVAVLVILAAVTVLVSKAQADAIVPIVQIQISSNSIVEGPTEGVSLDVTVTNPTPTVNLNINELLIDLSDVAAGDPDRTDKLTLAGTRVTLAGCPGLNIPAAGVKGLPGVVLGPGGVVLGSCTDVIFIPVFDMGLKDEGKDNGVPDSGTTTVNVSVVTAGGVHSVIETEDVDVSNQGFQVPEPSSALLLGSGLLALAIVLMWKGLRRERLITEASS